MDEFEFSQQLKDKIVSSSNDAYSETMVSLKVLNNTIKIETILMYFALKRPDIGYQDGMNHLAAFLCSVFQLETDIFVIFCHIIENIFPEVLFI